MFFLLERSLGSVVLRWRRLRRALSGDIALGHATIDGKVMAVDEAGLIAGQEENCISLLNGLTEASRRQVNLSSVSLLLVVTKPILQQWGVEGCRAKTVESESVAGVDHGQLSCQSEHGTLGRSVGELGSGSTDEGDDGGGVDDGAAVLLVATEGEDGVLAAEPDTLDVDVLGKVPDGFGGIDGVGIVSMHDAGIVEDHINTTPRVERLNHGLDFGFLADIASLISLVYGGRYLLVTTHNGLDSDSVGNKFLYFREGLFERRS